jgi:L-aminopeptidase/D-esterase-like protein
MSTAPGIAEFIDAHHALQPGDRPVVDLGAVGAGLGAGAGAGLGPLDAARRRLDTQTRIDIARWAEEYIARLVENHHGDRHDVRTVVDDLNRRTNVIGATGRFIP